MDTLQRKIYLVRHAESAWNSERRVQGTCLEVPLSPAGRIQAEKLGRRLGTLEFHTAFSSDAVRAVETARIALGDDRPITVSSDFRELSLGEWEGRLISEIRVESPEKVELWYRKPTSVALENGEDFRAFRKRVVAVMNRIIGDSDGGDLLVITHGGFICSYLTHVLNMDVDDIWSFSLPNASLTTLVLDFKTRLRSFGDTSHLELDAAGENGIS
jgi:broad specificity phosphatase PhoE